MNFYSIYFDRLVGVLLQSIHEGVANVAQYNIRSSLMATSKSATYKRVAFTAWQNMHPIVE